MKNILFSLFVGVVLSLQFSASVNAQEEETIFDLPWTIGEEEVDLLHIPASIKISETQAILTGNAAIDFERLGFGLFTFRAPAVLVNLTEENNILDNIYLHYYEIGNVSMDNWGATMDIGGLEKSFKESLSTSNELRADADKLEFARWVETPILHKDSATIYYAFELDEASGGKYINAKAMKLTRHGYILVTWIAEPELFQSAEQNLTPILDSIILDAGTSYADFDEGADVVAGDDASSLLEKTIKGETIAEGAAKGALLAVILGFAKKLWWLIIIPFVGAWKWLKNKRTNSSSKEGAKSGVDKYYKHLWKALFAIGLVGATFIVFGIISFNYSRVITYDDNVNEITGIVWQADQDAPDIKHIDLTLAGNEQPFRFYKTDGIKSMDVWDVVLKSYNEGSRLVLKYDAGRIPDDKEKPIKILAVQSDEDTILSLEQTVAHEENDDRTTLNKVWWSLLLPIFLLVGSYVFYAKMQTENKPTKQVLYWVMIPSAIASMVVASYLYLAWANSQDWLAESLENDGDYKESFKVADFALTWAIVEKNQESNLYYIRAESLQELGRRKKNDDQIFASIADFEEAMRLDPGIEDKTIKQIGYSLTYLGAYDEATEAFKKITGPLDTFIRQALVQRILGNYEAANALYQQGYEVYEQWYGMPINYHRAKNAVLAGEFQTAIEAIDIGLEHQIDYGSAYMIRGCAKASIADIDGAVSDYEYGLGIWNALDKEKIQFGTLPKSIKEVEGELEKLRSLDPSDDNFDVTNYDFCSVHVAESEIKRERSPLLPAVFEREYLIVEAVEGELSDGY